MRQAFRGQFTQLFGRSEQLERAFLVGGSRFLARKVEVWEGLITGAEVQVILTGGSSGTGRRFE